MVESDASIDTENEADAIGDTVLSTTVEFLDHFDAALDVVVGCARKTEMTRWRRLFSIVGNPKTLFEVGLPIVIMENLYQRTIYRFALPPIGSKLLVPICWSCIISSSLMKQAVMQLDCCGARLMQKTGNCVENCCGSYILSTILVPL